MKRKALIASVLLMSAGVLSAGFSVGRPAAVKKQVTKLDDKVHAKLLAGAASNHAPANVAVVAVSTTVAAGGLAILSASATDADGDPLQYAWTAPSGTLSASTGQSVYWLAPSTPGVYTVTCAVSDGKTAAPGSVAVAAVAPGTQKWAFAASDTFSASPSPAVDKNGVVYVTSDGGALYAINPDGSQKWVFNTAALTTAYGPVLAADGTIYAVAATGDTYALNPDKTLKWAAPFTPAGTLNTFPPVPGPAGKVYVFDDSNNLYEVSPLGVGVSTFTDLPNAIAQPPVIGADGTIYLVDGGDNLYAVSPSGVYTTVAEASNITAPPAVASDGTIYLVEANTDVHILKPDLSPKFAPFTPPSSPNISLPPVIAPDGSVYVFDDFNSLLYKINPASGAGAQFSALASVQFGPVTGPDSVVYAVDDNGVGDYSLHGLVPAGTDKWTPFQPLGTPIIASAPGVGADGTVAFTADDGNVYALNSTSVLP